MSAAGSPIGVVLAGGRGRHLGGEKTLVSLRGRTLAAWVFDALHAVLDDVVVACKPDTALPPLEGLREAWVEPAEPRSPLAAIRWALEQAGGRPIVVCGLAFPLLEARHVAALADADAAGSPAVVVETAFGPQPLVARYDHAALSALPEDGSLPLGPAVAALEPRLLALDGELWPVLTPEDLLRADAVLDRRRAVRERAASL